MSQNVPTTAVTPAVSVQTPPAEAAQAPTTRTTGEQRAADIKAQLQAAEDKAEAAEEKAATAPAKPANKPAPKVEKQEPVDTEERKPEPAEAKSDDADESAARAKKESADRLARINAVREKDEASRKENERRKAAKKAAATPAVDAGEIERLRKRVAELEPANEAASSPMALLAWAEKRGHSPQEVANALRQRLTDPAEVAAQHTRTTEEKLRAEYDAKIAALEAKFEASQKATAEERRIAREEADGAARANEFLTQAASSEAHPRTARLLKSKGVPNFINWVNTQVVAHLDEGYSTQYLHDVTEQYLEWLQDGGESPDPANGASQHPKNGAAKPVTTLSGALTSGRTMVTEETPLSRLSKKDRVAAVKAMAERED